MKHDVTIKGSAFALRPVIPADAAFIVELRTDPELGRHIHGFSASIEDQRHWIDRYLQRPQDWYFIIETAAGVADGTIGLYDLDAGAQAAEWGRWLLRHGSWGAVESASLMYDFAFGQLGLDTVYCRTRADNRKVLSFHTSFGLRTVGAETCQEDGCALVRQEITSSEWSEQRAAIRERVDQAASFALR